MNERIKELASQCWDLRLDGRHFDQEQFAELIVRKCTDIALEQKKWVEDQKVHNPADERWNTARIHQSQHIVDKIKQHFGVEE
jgi:sugar diacid utilization regulator